MISRVLFASGVAAVVGALGASLKALAMSAPPDDEKAPGRATIADVVVELLRRQYGRYGAADSPTSEMIGGYVEPAARSRFSQEQRFSYIEEIIGECFLCPSNLYYISTGWIYG